ncbi:MAG: hypothetical protein SGPRY_004455 [Prymnesium sp.]
MLEITPDDRTAGAVSCPPGSQLSMVFREKMSKRSSGYAEKVYRISLWGVKPAAFGTTKVKKRELAFAMLTPSEWVGTMNAPHTLGLQCQELENDAHCSPNVETFASSMERSMSTASEVSG